MIAKVYLVAYNTLQFLMWSRLFITLVSTPYPMTSHLPDVTALIVMPQLFNFLETIHPAVGLIRGGW